MGWQIVLVFALGCGRIGFDATSAGDGGGGTDSGGLPANGLVAHWPLDDTSGTVAIDTVGQSPGVYMDGASPATDSVPGVYGGAIDFDTGGGYIDLGAAPALDLATTFTFTAWVQPQGFSMNANGNGMLFSAGDIDSAYWNAALSDDGVDMRFGYSPDRGRAVLSAPVTSRIGQWMHVAIVKDGDAGTNVTLYIDGREVATGAAGPTGSVGAKTIGSDKEGDYDEQVDAILDDLRLYDRALSAAEIAACCPP